MICNKKNLFCAFVNHLYPISDTLDKLTKLFQIRKVCVSLCDNRPYPKFASKVVLMTLITNTNFVFKLRLVFVPIWGKTLVPYCRTKRQKNHCFNMVRLRKISLAESRGSSRFFNNKVVSDFDFGHFLKFWKILFSDAIFEQFF